MHGQCLACSVWREGRCCLHQLPEALDHVGSVPVLSRRVYARRATPSPRNSPVPREPCCANSVIRGAQSLAVAGGAPRLGVPPPPPAAATPAPPCDCPGTTLPPPATTTARQHTADPCIQSTVQNDHGHACHPCPAAAGPAGPGRRRRRQRPRGAPSRAAHAVSDAAGSRRMRPTCMWALPRRVLPRPAPPPGQNDTLRTLAPMPCTAGWTAQSRPPRLPAWRRTR